MKKIFILISALCVSLIILVLAFNIYSMFSSQKPTPAPVQEVVVPEPGVPLEEVPAAPLDVVDEQPSFEIPDNSEPSFRTPANADPNAFYIQ